MGLANEILESVNELLEVKQNYKDFETWKKNASSRGLVVRKAIHPSGEDWDYHTAKDSNGNKRGHFDHHAKKGHLIEDEWD